MIEGIVGAVLIGAGIFLVVLGFVLRDLKKREAKLKNKNDDKNEQVYGDSSGWHKKYNYKNKGEDK